MKRTVILIAVFLWTNAAFSQNIFKAFIKDAVSKAPVAGAAAYLSAGNPAGIADSTGLITLTGLPAGKLTVRFHASGYFDRIDTLIFPYLPENTRVIFLNRQEEDLEEVVVSATRSSRTIAGIPTRVEVISGEELEEKAVMKPGDIRMLLAESTGVQTQQTSATSANSSIRIQGLDGKYTQIIRDGFPLYAGFSGGLGLLQIAPLDLQQVEVIKGSSSTLYGGGAIAGLVNLVSKKPSEQRQINFLLNGTSAAGADISSFYAKRNAKAGTTIYASYNHGTAYDPSGIDLTAIPEYDRITLNPKLFLYFSERSRFSIGLNATTEKRTGGDLHYIQGDGDGVHSYFERNLTRRFSGQAEFIHELSDSKTLTLKTSASYYNRKIELPAYIFSGIQHATFTEAAYSSNGKRSDWVAGLNYLSDNFQEKAFTSFPLRNYSDHTFGMFLQNTWDVASSLTIESGIRTDFQNNYGTMVLPRVTALIRFSPKISSRLGSSFGYKAPNVFTEEAERIQFRNVLPLNGDLNKAERSFGVNYDLQYNTSLFNEQVALSINQLFFYTRINDPILLTPQAGGNLKYTQPGGDLNTKGIETNLKIIYGDLKLFVGYTFADVRQHTLGNVTRYPLVSRHRLNNVLMYEADEKWKLGAEAYFFSRQLLTDGLRGKSYWITGFLAERLWKRFSLFINFENFTDTRQTKFDTIYTGTVTNPVFRDIYAPVDGFVVNGGIKLSFSNHVK